MMMKAVFLHLVIFSVFPSFIIALPAYDNSYSDPVEYGDISRDGGDVSRPPGSGSVPVPRLPLHLVRSNSEEDNLNEFDGSFHSAQSNIRFGSFAPEEVDDIMSIGSSSGSRPVSRYGSPVKQSHAALSRFHQSMLSKEKQGIEPISDYPTTNGDDFKIEALRPLAPQVTGGLVDMQTSEPSTPIYGQSDEVFGNDDIGESRRLTTTQDLLIIPSKITPRNSHTWPANEQQIYLQIKKLLKDYNEAGRNSKRTLRETRDSLTTLALKIRSLVNQALNNEQLVKMSDFYTEQAQSKASSLNKNLMKEGIFDAHGYLAKGGNLKRWHDLLKSMQHYLTERVVAKNSLQFTVITGKSEDLLGKHRKGSMRAQLAELLDSTGIEYRTAAKEGQILISKQQLRPAARALEKALSSQQLI